MSGDPIICELELKKFSATMSQLKELVAGLNDVNKALGSAGGSKSPKVPKVPKPPPTMQEKLMTALMSSRIGSGGNLMPLVGNLAKVLGPAALPILAAVEGIKMLGEAASATAALLGKNAQSYYKSGGTPGELAIGDMIGRATGTNISDLARQHQAAINGGGMPTAMAAQHGVYDQPGMPNLNAMQGYLKQLFDVADKSKTTDAQAMRETMVDPALSPALQMRDMNPADLKEMKEIQSDMFSPESRAAAAHFQLLIAKIGLGFDSFVAAVGTPILEFLNHITGGTDGIKRFGKALGSMVAPIFEIANAVFDALPSFDAFSDWIELLIKDITEMSPAEFLKDAATGPAARAANAAVSATEDNTAAIREHTQIMREGTYGGGARTRGAIPGAYHGVNGQNTERFLQNNMNAMGAFGMGT